ncbi:uncharacterized protein LOC111328306 [Stylophora pistillata]|uniref:uncharacterized protein LOC111328306 n=1 Tax=Stylophora pistillata TaxID=50429 RepID=UPI000C04EF6D|nr:uncharacterized protein LOC111328306 [Stylophora pistillata]
MASKCGEEEEESRVDKLCSKSRKCSKSNYHSGRCDSKRAVVSPFWNRSPIQVGNAIKREARDAAEAITNDCDRKKIRVEEREASVNARESELVEKERKIHEVEERANATRLESDAVNLTVWTIGYAIPYHAELLYRQQKVGYGIISLQAKESKHSGVKQDLNLTNRSRSTSNVGKWWQLMRTNYVRAFYLPEHQPVPSTYISHFESRLPPHCKDTLNFC